MKKVFSIILCLCMVTALLPGTVLGAETSVWDGTIDTSWYTTNASSYTINTAAQLAGLAQLVNGGVNFAYIDIYLGRDIDLNNIAWTPIGNVDNLFIGSFKGQGHTISGLKTVYAMYNIGGLFGHIGNLELGGTSGSVFDLNVQGDVNGDIAGGIVATVLTGKIINCTFRGTVNAYRLAGGIVGNAIDTRIEYCASYAEVSAYGNENISPKSGRFVASISTSEVYSCYNTGYGSVLSCKLYHSANESMPHDEAAWRMNNGTDAIYRTKYSWTYNADGVMTTKNLQDGITQRFILNSGWDGADAETVYGTSQLVLPTPAEREGYTFYMWLSDDGVYYKAGDTIQEQGSHTLTALWYTSDTCDITIGAPENGTIALYLPDEPNVKYSEGTVIEGVNVGKTIIVEYTADGSYELANITVNGVNTSMRNITVTQDLTISASFIVSTMSPTTVASVTVVETGAKRYFDSIVAAMEFVNICDSMTLINLYNDVEIQLTQLPTKAFTMDGENGEDDFELKVINVDESQLVELPGGTTLSNLKFNAEMVGAIENSIPYRLTLENVRFMHSKAIITHAGELRLRGTISGISQIGKYNVEKIVFDNATVYCDYNIKRGKMEFLGDNTLKVMKRTSNSTSESVIAIMGETEDDTSEGTLTVMDGGNWAPQPGDLFLQYTDRGGYLTHDSYGKIILQLNDGIDWRFKVVKRRSYDYYVTEYFFYNPTIALAASTPSPSINVTSTLTATPSIKGNYISSTDYRWYQCDNAEGRNAELIEGADTGTYSVSHELGGTYYYYCVLPDANGDEVQSNIVELTVRAPWLPIPSGLAWGEGELAGFASWNPVENAQGYSIQLYKGTVETGEPILTQETSCDCNAVIANGGAGVYFFRVTALGNITTTSNSSKKITTGYTAPAVTYDITYAPGASADSEQAELHDTKNHPEALTLRGASFTRALYRQIGWATSDGGEKVYELGGEYTENTAVTLYPVWEVLPASFELSPSENNVFPMMWIGYAESVITARTVTVKNTGGVDAEGITVALSGEDAENFVLSGSWLPNIAPGGTASFSVCPKTGFAEGVHTVTATVSGSGMTDATATFKLTVLPKLEIASAPVYLKSDDDGLFYSRNNVEWTAYAGRLGITGSSLTNSVIVQSGAHDIAFKDVNIEATASAVSVESGATLRLVLLGENILKGGVGAAGIHVPEGAELVIDESSTGTLNVSGGTSATAGEAGAGIGGASGESAGIVTIYGGIVTATGGSGYIASAPVVLTFEMTDVIIGGAGIGGGFAGAGGTVNIPGGTVTATGGKGAAGIGSGFSDKITTIDAKPHLTGGTVNISGGTVTAKGGTSTYTYQNKLYTVSGAGIGGGYNASGGVVNISGGTVTATGGTGGGGAGIGSGYNGLLIKQASGAALLHGGTVNISGGTVKANGDCTTSSDGGSGIGGGYMASGADVTVSGGVIWVEKKIGAGQFVNNARTTQGSLTITGGNFRGALRSSTELIPTNGVENGSQPLTDAVIRLGYAAKNRKLLNMTGMPEYYNNSDLYADLVGNAYVWLPEGYTVDNISASYAYVLTFDSCGGSEIEPLFVANGQTATLPVPTREGYDFLGWFAEGTQYTSETAITSDVTLSADWLESGPAVITIRTVTEENSTLSTIIAADREAVVTLVFALYDEEGRFMALDIQEDVTLQTGDNTFPMSEALYSLEAISVKVMVLESLESMRPVCAAFKYENAV